MESWTTLQRSSIADLLWWCQPDAVLLTTPCWNPSDWHMFTFWAASIRSFEIAGESQRVPVTLMTLGLAPWFVLPANMRWYLLLALMAPRFQQMKLRSGPSPTCDHPPRLHHQALGPMWLAPNGDIPCVVKKVGVLQRLWFAKASSKTDSFRPTSWLKLTSQPPLNPMTRSFMNHFLIIQLTLHLRLPPSAALPLCHPRCRWDLNVSIWLNVMISWLSFVMTVQFKVATNRIWVASWLIWSILCLRFRLHCPLFCAHLLQLRWIPWLWNHHPCSSEWFLDFFTFVVDGIMSIWRHHYEQVLAAEERQEQRPKRVARARLAWRRVVLLIFTMVASMRQEMVLEHMQKRVQKPEEEEELEPQTKPNPREKKGPQTKIRQAIGKLLNRPQTQKLHSSGRRTRWSHYQPPGRPSEKIFKCRVNPYPFHETPPVPAPDISSNYSEMVRFAEPRWDSFRLSRFDVRQQLADDDHAGLRREPTVIASDDPGYRDPLSIAVVDARSLYDTAATEQTAGEDDRSAPEVAIIQDSLRKCKGRVRWVPHNMNPAWHADQTDANSWSAGDDFAQDEHFPSSRRGRCFSHMSATWATEED